MKKLVLLCISLIPTVAVAAEPFALKGVEVGGKADAAQLSSSLGITCTGNFCSIGQAQIAGTWCETMVVINASGEMAEITAFFPTLSFDPIEHAFALKYGKPSSVSRAAMSTVGGVHLNNVIETWRNASGDKIEIAKYADGAQGIVRIQSKAQVSAEAAKSKKAENDI